jgi:hypothetical protein
MRFEEDIMSLPNSSSIFCLIIDTFKEKKIWKKILGQGALGKISNVDVRYE